MYCMKCGRQLVPDAKYCKYCGAKTLYGLKIEEAAVESTEPPALLEENKEKAVLGKKGRIAAITAAVILVLGTGFFLVWRFKNNPQEGMGRNIPTGPALNELAEEEESLPEEEPVQSLEKLEKQEEKVEGNFEYRKTSQIYRNMNGKEVSRMDFSYDEGGNISHAVRSYPDGTTENIYYEYEYDENGALVKENQYDENGRLKLEKFYNVEDGEPDWIEYSYYEDGRLESSVEYENGKGILRQTYHPEGTQSFQIMEYKRNSDGNVTTETEQAYDSQGILIGTYIYEYFYDDNGNLSGWESNEDMHSWSADFYGNDEWLGTINYNEDGTVDMQPAEGYEPAGNGFVKIGSPRDTLSSYSEDTYDDAGNVVKTSWFNKSGELLYSYEYEYEKLEVND
ncbi:hypothetical protein B5F29_13525 [Lachnoclostridium sp. An196]|nr:hypothetical protein B5F29_13525 [Lachnoclostridium sp. An196]